MTTAWTQGTIFPLAWSLFQTEQAILVRLASADVAVSIADLAQDRVRTGGPKGRAVKVHIHNIRKKLEPHGIRINTVRGIGYRLAPDCRAIVLPHLAKSKQATAA